MNSEEKQYAVLQNVTFYEQTNSVNNNFNLLPITPCNAVISDAVPLPSTSQPVCFVQDIRSGLNNADAGYSQVQRVIVVFSASCQ